MRYSSYVTMITCIGIVVVAFFGALIVSIGGLQAVGYVILLALVMLVGLGLSVAWAHRAVTDGDGAPFPGLLGVAGFRIIPDDAPPEPVADATGVIPVQESSSDPNWGNALIRQSESGSAPTTASSASATPSNPSGYRCPKCGAVTEGAGTEFCRSCGASLALP